MCCMDYHKFYKLRAEPYRSVNVKLTTHEVLSELAARCGKRQWELVHDLIMAEQARVEGGGKPAATGQQPENLLEGL